MFDCSFLKTYIQSVGNHEILNTCHGNCIHFLSHNIFIFLIAYIFLMCLFIYYYLIFFNIFLIFFVFSNQQRYP